MLAHLLSLLIWLPILFGVIVLGMGRLTKSAAVCKGLGIFFALVILAFCIPLYVHFDAGLDAFQFTETSSWIPALNIQYALGVDGISVLFILLTCFTNLIMMLSGWKYVKDSVAEYVAIFLFSTGILNGLFAAQDGILFYVFWEASTLPILMGIGVWGGSRRAYAAVKFFLYNMLGSLMLLAGLAYLYIVTGTFNLTELQGLSLPTHVQDWLFLAFFAGFAVKMPMWPFHTWFADLHAEAPAGGAIALATLMLKNGAYGFLRFSLPITPGVDHGLVMLLIILSLVAVVYVGFASLVQKDMKRLIAYSSISHMGIAVLGIFMALLIVSQADLTHFSNHADAVLALQGGIFQMVTHAFASGGLFILVALLAQRYGSSLIQDYQGLAKTFPVLAFFFVVFSMANVGLPGTAGFVGEFFVVLASLQGNFWIAVLAACTLVISPAYMLWLVKRVIFGEVNSQNPVQSAHLSGIDWLMMILLAVPVVYFGVFPHPVLHLSYMSSEHIVDLIARGQA